MLTRLLLAACACGFLPFFVYSQAIPYGNNPAAGHYCNVGDTRLYYEIYGNGEPLVLLHGGVYGYIDEFESLIPKLAEHYRVICIATRGHGRSGIGTQPFTYRQRAEDAYKVIRSVTHDRVTVVGFSDGGFAGLKLAALHPELVKKLVAMGVGDYPLSHTEKVHYTAEGLMRSDSVFFMSRRQLMPEPGRWEEFLKKINQMYNTDFVSKETFEKIQCPVLVIVGQKDENNSMENVNRAVNWIPNHRLTVIPNCGHVILFCNFSAVWAAMTPFLY